MASNPQIVAKAILDTTGIKGGLNSASKQIAGFEKTTKRSMRNAFSGAFRGAGLGTLGLSAGVLGGLGTAIGATISKGMTARIASENSGIFLKHYLGSESEAKKATGRIASIIKKNPIFSKVDTQNAFAELAPFSGKNVDKLEKIVGLAQKLAVVNPAQGLKGATFAVKEAMSGDLVSLAERFNFSKTKMQELKDAGMQGDQIIATMLNRMGITDETLNDFSNSFSGMTQRLKNDFSQLAEEMAGGLFVSLGPKLEEIRGFLSENKEAIIQIANGTVSAISAIGQAAAMTAQIADVTGQGMGAGAASTIDQYQNGELSIGKGIAGILGQGGAVLGAGVTHTAGAITGGLGDIFGDDSLKGLGNSLFNKGNAVWNNDVVGKQAEISGYFGATKAAEANAYASEIAAGKYQVSTAQIGDRGTAPLTPAQQAAKAQAEQIRQGQQSALAQVQAQRDAYNKDWASRNTTPVDPAAMTPAQRAEAKRMGEANQRFSAQEAQVNDYYGKWSAGNQAHWDQQGAAQTAANGQAAAYNQTVITLNNGTGVPATMSPQPA